MGDEAEILEHRADAAAKAGQAGARQGDHVRAEHADHPARGPLREVEQAQHAGLAGAAGPGEEIETAGIEREGDVAQHLAIGAITQPDIVELDDACGVLVHALAKGPAKLAS